MDEIIPTVNMVVYLVAGTLKGTAKSKKKDSYLGGHGYTYDSTQEGKKKLVKDVATSTGYYTGNPNRPNTVIAVKDIVSLTAEAERSELEALFNGLQAVLEKFVVANSEYRNLYIVTPLKELDYLLRMSASQLEGEGCLKLGKTDLTLAESQLARMIYEMVQDLGRKTTPGLVIVDLDASAEGGAGMREVSKQVEMANTLTTWSDYPGVTLTIMARKDHENPESDFVKIVSATKWYADTHNKDDFYKKNGDYRVYDFGKVEPKKCYFGKITPDVTYSRLYILKPIEVLDKLFEFMAKRIANPEGYLAAGDLRTIVSKDVTRMIDGTPGIPDKRTLISPITRGNDRPVLMELITPIQMTYRIRESLMMLDIALAGFLKKEDNKFGYLRFYDITDLIYVKEPNGKGVIKLKLNPEFNQNKLIFNVDVEHPKALKPVKLMLSVGFDLPERNAFNSVEDPDVEVWVVTDVRNDTGLRYLTIVKTKDYIYIHTSAAANLRVLTLAELGKKR